MRVAGALSSQALMYEGSIHLFVYLCPSEETENVEAAIGGVIKQKVETELTLVSFGLYKTATYEI